MALVWAPASGEAPADATRLVVRVSSLSPLVWGSRWSGAGASPEGSVSSGLLVLGVGLLVLGATSALSLAAGAGGRRDDG